MAPIDNFQLTAHLFLQLAVIVGACRICGRLLRWLGQTQVVSEMIAGVLLGPSLLGLLFPWAGARLFPATLPPTVSGLGVMETPHPSMSLLHAVSHIGLVLYMFLIGLEMDRGLLSRHSRHAAFISLAGIFTPVAMGGLLGLSLSRSGGFFQEGMPAWRAAFFMASAMSITAFPTLARILHETKMNRTKIGTLVIGSAAIDDAVAWCLLACVVASASGSPAVALAAVGGGISYAMVMLTAGRSLLARLDRAWRRNGEAGPESLAVLLGILMVCAWLTDRVGIHSVFGAFLMGIAMPRGPLAEGVRQSLEKITVTLLLPVFFAYSGLNTRLDLLIRPELIGVAVAVVATAFLCKGGGCLLAARAVGSRWREAAMIGVLMNTRGMMELILANIALEKGLITPELFTMLVLMAVVSTLAASPLFQLLRGEAFVAGKPRSMPSRAEDVLPSGSSA